MNDVCYMISSGRILPQFTEPTASGSYVRHAALYRCIVSPRIQNFIIGQPQCVFTRAHAQIIVLFCVKVLTLLEKVAG
jgi:hypothetical protein